MKQGLQYIVAFLSYWLGLSDIFYAINKKAKRVITFHNVIPDNLCPPSMVDSTVCTESSFRRILAEIRTRFRVSNDLADTQSVTLTFDDGYLNQYEIASRVLDQMGNLPAALFVSGANRDNTNPNKALVVDLLLLWVNFARPGKYSIAGKTFELTSSNRHLTWVSILRPAFVADVDSGGENVLKELSSQCSVALILGSLSPEYVRLRYTGVSSTQIDELRKRGWRVGWHTRKHFPLKALSMERKRDELTPDQDMNGEWFSYPYGESMSVGDADLKMVEKSGYPCAFSNINYDTELRGRFFLPRMGLKEDRYLLHYELSGLKHFLKHFGLLPRITYKSYEYYGND